MLAREEPSIRKTRREPGALVRPTADRGPEAHALTRHRSQVCSAIRLLPSTSPFTSSLSFLPLLPAAELIQFGSRNRTVNERRRKKKIDLRNKKQGVSFFLAEGFNVSLMCGDE